MSSVVHYKFKNEKKWHNIAFEGQVISVLELKRAIVDKHKLGKGDDTAAFDLQIRNKQDGLDYKENNFKVHKNAHLEVKRVPAHQTTYFEISQAPTLAAEGKEGIVNKTEEELKAAAEQKRIMEDAIKVDKLDYQANRKKLLQQNMGTVPPPDYTCHRCGKAGHWIQNCTSQTDARAGLLHGVRVKRLPPGIPRTSLYILESLDELNDKTKNIDVTGGIVQLNDGKYAVIKPNVKAFNEAVGKDKRIARKKRVDIRLKTLTCPLCDQIFTDPVKVRCCGQNFCNECIRQKLMESDTPTCPSCNQGIALEELDPNNVLNDAAKAYKQEQANQVDEPVDHHQYSHNNNSQQINYQPSNQPHYNQYQPPIVDNYNNNNYNNNNYNHNNYNNHNKRYRPNNSSDQYSKRQKQNYGRQYYGHNNNNSNNNSQPYPADPYYNNMNPSGYNNQYNNNYERSDNRREQYSDRKPRSSDRKYRDSDKKYRDSDRKYRDSDRKHRDSDRKHRDSDKKHRDSDRKNRDSDRKYRDSDKKHRDSDKKHRDSDRKHRDSDRKRSRSRDRHSRRDKDKRRRSSSRDNKRRSRDRDHRSKRY